MPKTVTIRRLVQYERIGGQVPYWADFRELPADAVVIKRAPLEAARITAALDKFATGRVRIIERKTTTREKTLLEINPCL